jgi:hypothetical protein
MGEQRIPWASSARSRVGKAYHWGLPAIETATGRGDEAKAVLCGESGDWRRMSFHNTGTSFDHAGYSVDFTME